MAEKEREENVARVVEFPKEVRVYGNISHVYFEGKSKFTTLINEPSAASPSGAQGKKEKRAKEPVLIVPIKQKNSELHFVKVPLQKLSKFPKSEKLRKSFCPRVSMHNQGLITERLPEYKTNLKEISRKQFFPKTENEFDTCFVFKQGETFQRSVFTDSLPIANLFQFQEKSKVDAIKEEAIVKEPKPVLKRKPSVKEANTNTNTQDSDRYMRFLVSPKKRKRKSK